MTQLLFYSLIGGVFSLIGGFLLLWNKELTKKFITPLISIGAGAFLGSAFLDIIPEAVEMVGEPHPVLVAVVAGFAAYFILERYVMVYIRGKPVHEHSEHTETLPLLIILGDGIHNFLDGIVIALAYLANPVLGLSATLAVAAHEIPQEIGDFSVLLKLGYSKKKVILINIFQSLLTIPGVLLGFFGGSAVSPYIPQLLGLAAGIFIYIAASDLVPELHHQAGHKHFASIVLPFVIALFAISFLTDLAHG